MLLGLFVLVVFGICTYAVGATLHNAVGRCEHRSLFDLAHRTELKRLIVDNHLHTCAELGVQAGLFSRDLLMNNPVITKYHLVDSWEHQDNYVDIANVQTSAHLEKLSRTVTLLRPFQNVTLFHVGYDTSCAQNCRPQRRLSLRRRASRLLRRHRRPVDVLTQVEQLFYCSRSRFFGCCRGTSNQRAGLWLVYERHTPQWCCQASGVGFSRRTESTQRRCRWQTTHNNERRLAFLVLFVRATFWLCQCQRKPASIKVLCSQSQSYTRMKRYPSWVASTTSSQHTKER
jgi:hypothetical protein